jgi:hypothetical protein
MACSIEGCARPVLARGWCGTHYQRWRHTGTTDDPPPRLSDLERYLSKIAPPDKNGCRLWIGAPDKDGYGRFSIGWAPQIWYRAHRYGYTQLVGPIPPGLHVCHSCDIPACQTPEHWCCRSGLTISDGTVRECRRLHVGGLSYGAIDRALGLKRGTARRFVLRESRAGVE